MKKTALGDELEALDARRASDERALTRHAIYVLVTGSAFVISLLLHDSIIRPGLVFWADQYSSLLVSISMLSFVATLSVGFHVCFNTIGGNDWARAFIQLPGYIFIAWGAGTFASSL